jgi:Leucine-rich repeat (LRR) protein
MRLDLSFNRLVALPSGISLLTGLEQLWLNDSPFLATVPPSLQLCKKLQVLDLRRTAILTLPREMGRLKHLVEVDLRETPFADR